MTVICAGGTEPKMTGNKASSRHMDLAWKIIQHSGNLKRVYMVGINVLAAADERD